MLPPSCSCRAPLLKRTLYGEATWPRPTPCTWSHGRYTVWYGASTTKPIAEIVSVVPDLEELAAVAAGQKHTAYAARLYGAAAALRKDTGVPLQSSDRAQYERLLATVRAQLDTDTFAAMWAEGQSMPLEQAVAYAQAATTDLLARER